MTGVATAGRIQARVVTKPGKRWGLGLPWLLLDQHPEGADDRSAGARTLTDADRGESSRTSRWTTLA